MYEYNNCACRATITTSIIIARPSSTASTRNCAPGGTQNNYCEYTYCASTKQLLRVHLLRVHKTTAGTQLRVQRYKSNYYCEQRKREVRVQKMLYPRFVYSYLRFGTRVLAIQRRVSRSLHCMTCICTQNIDFRPNYALIMQLSH